MTNSYLPDPVTKRMLDKVYGNQKSRHSKSHSGLRELPPRSILPRGSHVRLKPYSRHGSLIGGLKQKGGILGNIRLIRLGIVVTG